MTYEENLAKLREAGVVDMRLSFGCEIKTTINSYYGNKYDEKEYTISTLQNNYNLKKLIFMDCFGDLQTIEDWIEIYDKLYENDEEGYKQKMYSIEILGHPLTIGRVLRWIESNSKDNMFMNYYIEDLYMMVMDIRHNKDLPLDSQDNKEEIAEWLVSKCLFAKVKENDR